MFRMTNKPLKGWVDLLYCVVNECIVNMRCHIVTITLINQPINVLQTQHYSVLFYAIVNIMHAMLLYLLVTEKILKSIILNQVRLRTEVPSTPIQGRSDWGSNS